MDANNCNSLTQKPAQLFDTKTNLHTLIQVKSATQTRNKQRENKAASILTLFLICILIPKFMGREIWRHWGVFEGIWEIKNNPQSQTLDSCGTTERTVKWKAYK